MGKEEKRRHEEESDDAAMASTVHNVTVCSEQHQLRGISTISAKDVCSCMCDVCDDQRCVTSLCVLYMTSPQSVVC